MKPTLTRIASFDGVTLFARLYRADPHTESAYEFFASAGETRVKVQTSVFHAFYRAWKSGKLSLSEQQGRIFEAILKRNLGYNVRPLRYVTYLADALAVGGCAAEFALDFWAEEITRLRQF